MQLHIIRTLTISSSFLCFLFFATFLPQPVVHAQQRIDQAFYLTRISEPIALDGIINEPSWDAVEPFSLTMYQPVFGGDMSQHTEIKAVYDDSFLYLSGKMYDTEPDGIRVNSLYRDDWNGEDTFGIIIDTYNDKENALFFFTSPAGVRFDSAISNDGEYEGYIEPMNMDWNAHWDVATTQTDEGWFAEVRIPFSSLGFQDDDGRVELGLITWRYIARRNERHIFPSIPPDWVMGMNKPSQAQTVVLEQVQSSTPAYVTPYVLGGQTLLTDDSDDIVQQDRNRLGDIGLDLKYNITSNFTMDVTVNTDFAQVEADESQINLTRFSLFFPEKRQFFQERASIFNFITTRTNRLFYSRRIGINDDGDPVGILGGTRLVGRINQWDVGLMNLQTRRQKSVPTENFGIFRLGRQVINPLSYAGGLFTSRFTEAGSYNIAYGLDGTFNIGPDEYISLKWAHTFDRPLLEDASTLQTSSSTTQGGHAFAEWRRQRNRGLAYNFSVNWTHEKFEPGIGFFDRTGVYQPRFMVMHNVFAPDESRLQRRRYYSEGSLYVRNDTGSIESADISSFYSFIYKDGSYFFFGSVLNYEDLVERFDVSDKDNAFVEPGSYTFADFWVGYQFPSVNTFKGEARIVGGPFYDGSRYTASVLPVWTLSRHFTLSGEYQINAIQLPSRTSPLFIHLARLRIQTALNPSLSFSALVQHDTASDLFSINARARYHFGEAHDLWLVYNAGFNSQRERIGDRFTRPYTDNYALIFKYTHTFGI